jgi:hypothetical protein
VGVIGVAGFSVDLGALEQATQGINATLTQVDQGKVGDYDAAKSDFGNDDLANTVSDFSDRWQIGVQNLAKDAGAIADQVTNNLTAYRRTESANQQRFTGILSGSGSDPAGG